MTVWIPVLIGLMKNSVYYVTAFYSATFGSGQGGMIAPPAVGIDTRLKIDFYVL